MLKDFCPFIGLVLQVCQFLVGGLICGTWIASLHIHVIVDMLQVILCRVYGPCQIIPLWNILRRIAVVFIEDASIVKLIALHMVLFDILHDIVSLFCQLYLDCFLFVLFTCFNWIYHDFTNPLHIIDCQQSAVRVAICHRRWTALRPAPHFPCSTIASAVRCRRSAYIHFSRFNAVRCSGLFPVSLRHSRGLAVVCLCPLDILNCTTWISVCQELSEKFLDFFSLGVLPCFACSVVQFLIIRQHMGTNLSSTIFQKIKKNIGSMKWK